MRVRSCFVSAVQCVFRTDRIRCYLAVVPSSLAMKCISFEYMSPCSAHLGLPCIAGRAKHFLCFPLDRPNPDFGWLCESCAQAEQLTATPCEACGGPFHPARDAVPVAKWSSAGSDFFSKLKQPDREEPVRNMWCRVIIRPSRLMLLFFRMWSGRLICQAPARGYQLTI